MLVWTNNGKKSHTFHLPTPVVELAIATRVAQYRYQPYSVSEQIMGRRVAHFTYQPLLTLIETGVAQYKYQPYICVNNNGKKSCTVHLPSPVFELVIKTRVAQYKY